MARKPNYNFEKRRKELDRKAKKDAKREDRIRRREEGSAENVDESGSSPEAGESGQPGTDTSAV